jgi:DNA ligase-1
MDHIYELLYKVSRVNSPVSKQHFLESFEDQETLQRVLRLALDPFTKFGITDFPEGLEPSGVDPLGVLSGLATRQLTGNAARIALGAAVAGHSPESQEVFRRIIRKDLRCGVGDKIVERLYPGLLRRFDVMRADKVRPFKGEYYVEPKYDGLRCLIVAQGSTVTLYSRNGKEFTSSDHLKSQVREIGASLGDRVFDGELTSGNFNESSSSVRKKNSSDDSVVLNLFDLLTLSEWRDPQLTYKERRKRLVEHYVQTPNIRLVPSYYVGDNKQAHGKYLEFLDQGYEGAIIKRGEGLYRLKKHHDWMKLKEVNDVDLQVTHLVPGEGKYLNMLGAAVVSYRGRNVNIGSGWSDAERVKYWEDPKLLIGKVIEIQYHQETPDGSLRHPRFAKIREDKS